MLLQRDGEAGGEKSKEVMGAREGVDGMSCSLVENELREPCVLLKKTSLKLAELPLGGPQRMSYGLSLKTFSFSRSNGPL